MADKGYEFFLILLRSGAGGAGGKKHRNGSKFWPEE